NTKARQGLEFLSARTGIPTQAPPVPSEYTSPLSDLTGQGSIQSPFGSTPSPAVDFNATSAAPSVEGMPDFSGDFSLPPWMENGAAPDPLAGAGSGGLRDSMLPGGSESLAYDMFASTPPGAESAQSDPWGGLNLSSDSLNIDWSRGMDPSASTNGGHSAADQHQAWGGMDAYQQGNSANGASDNGMADWSMDNVPGFEPLEPGSLGFGQAAPPTFPQNGHRAGYAEASQGDWQNSSANAGPYGPMGPAGDFQLPTPTDLPGFDMSSQGEAKPWYALSSQLSPGMLPDPTSAHGFSSENPDEMTQHLAAPKKDQVMVTCPHCAEKVPDTSLSCTRCGFSFFVNCPHCHELVDVIEAKADVAEPCPYCGKSIEKMKLGMTSTDPTMTYVSERPTKPDAVAPAMKQYIKEATRRRGGFTWSWVVDVMWLAAIVMMVWVLTQLPAWWHLSGQY
ncbi:MAG: hypothetical protein M3328_12995, partial [Chloroflexota bacterium]|nr:hypothetical protein [Chloroflexota bacterium]